MPKKIPVPVAVAIAVVAVLGLVFVISRGSNNASGDTGDVSALAKQVMDNNPKNAPPLPAGIDIKAETAGGGPKGKMRSSAAP